MLKSGYIPFEKYSVALPYKEGDVRLNQSIGQRNQSLTHACMWLWLARMTSLAGRYMYRYVHGQTRHCRERGVNNVAMHIVALRNFNCPT